MGLPRKRRSARLRDYLKKNRNPVKPSTKQNKFSNTAVIGGIIKSRKSSLIHEISRHIGRSLVRHVTEECIVPPRISPCPRTGNRKASPKNKKKTTFFPLSDEQRCQTAIISPVPRKVAGHSPKQSSITDTTNSKL